MRVPPRSEGMVGKGHGLRVSTMVLQCAGVRLAPGKGNKDGVEKPDI